VGGKKSQYEKGRRTDLGSLSVGLALLLLGRNLTTDDELANVVGLVEVEEAADLGGTLGTEALGEDGVGEAGDVSLALLDDDEVEGTDVGTDDATTDGLALALSVLAGAVARVTLGEEELDTVGNEDTLLERETLLLWVGSRRSGGRVAGKGERGGGGCEVGEEGQNGGSGGGVSCGYKGASALSKGERQGGGSWTNVVTTGDPQDVALELVSEGVGGDLLGHALLVEDATVIVSKTLVSPSI
jgi:hypothetical protein